MSKSEAVQPVFVLMLVGYDTQILGVFDSLERAQSHVRNHGEWVQTVHQYNGVYIATINAIEHYRIEFHPLNHGIIKYR